jgi:hypothetical protein
MKRSAGLIKSLMITALAFAASAPAQIGSLPETAFGAHGLALGRSAMASSHDALSGSWNPASI